MRATGAISYRKEGERDKKKKKRERERGKRLIVVHNNRNNFWIWKNTKIIVEMENGLVQTAMGLILLHQDATYSVVLQIF